MTKVVVGLAGGMLLAFRFKVWVLLPATLLAMAVISGTCGINWPNAGLMLLTSAAIQVGYFFVLLVKSSST